jgi:hypothetical protein
LNTKQCSHCLDVKELSFFDKNGIYTYTVCKACKKLKSAARRYGVPIQEIERLYAHSHCMCCGDKFKNNYHQHIHHTIRGIQGVLCRPCNRIVGKQSEIDVYRIEKCLEFMGSDRKNLFNRDNQQGSPLDYHHDPSTTVRLTRKLHRAMQAQCYTFDLTLDQVKVHRQKQKCDCCEYDFNKKNFSTIHHVGIRFLVLFAILVIIYSDKRLIIVNDV